ncbi:MAG TPA: glutathione S-transferase family protein [Noviherbaspirillum sp.]|nr:glutathione S-transferase family protein [Noviherbaspirillum sp.]
MRLHYYPGNANLAPHMLLEELGVPYELALVDRSVNAQKSAEYTKLNPAGRIPTLVDGDLVLFESAAICLHLCDTHPDAGLAPPLGSAERAHFYKWLMYLTNTVQTEMLFYFYPERLADDEAARAQVKRHAQERVADMFDLLERAYVEQGGPYFLGARFTAVDCYLLMVSRWTRAMQRPAREREHLGPYLRRLLERPAIARAFESEGIQAPWI